MQIAIIIILSILVGIFLLYIITSNLAIKDMNSQLEYINTNDTNKVINLLFRRKKLVQLASDLNVFIEKKQKEEIKYKNIDNDLKATIANVTHDLRTPLTVANGYIKLLQNEEVDSENQKLYIKQIDTNLTRLTEQLQTLFEYTKIQEKANKLVYDQINLSQLLIESCLSFYDEFTNKEIAMELDIQEHIVYITDEELIKRIIGNLLQNVLHHGKDTACIKLMEKSNTIIIETRNMCINPNVDANKIFDRFYTEDFSRTNQNTGLGLSIVKDFVEQLNGDISAQINNEEFMLTITLPIHTEN